MLAPQLSKAFQWTEVGGVVVIHFTVKVLYDDQIIRAVFDELDRLVEAGRTRMVINFSGIEVFASYVIGKLLPLNNRIAERSGRLVLTDLTPIVQDIANIMHLHRKFAIMKTEREALESFV